LIAFDSESDTDADVMFPFVSLPLFTIGVGVAIAIGIVLIFRSRFRSRYRRRFFVHIPSSLFTCSWILDSGIWFLDTRYMLFQWLSSLPAYWSLVPGSL